MQEQLPKTTKVHLKDKLLKVIQASINPLAITDGEIRTYFINLAQSMTTQPQALVVQENHEVAPHVKQNARFIPKEDKFTNLRQRGISVQEYSFKFTMLSIYVSSLVSNHRDEMSHFMTGVSDAIKEECRAAMRNDNMEIYNLMVFD